MGLLERRVRHGLSVDRRSAGSVLLLRWWLVASRSQLSSLPSLTTPLRSFGPKSRRKTSGYMILLLLLALVAVGVSGRRLVHANVRTALHAVKESYYFGSRSQSPAAAHKPLYVAPSAIDIESSVREAGRATRNPSQPSALTSETLRERSASHQTEKRYPDAAFTERSSTRVDYSFGARLPTRGESVPQRPSVDVAARFESQPSRPSSESPSKADYSFGARTSKRGESVSQRASVDVRSRVDEQPSESSWSRAASTGPVKADYSFGARIPKRGESVSQRASVDVRSRVEEQPTESSWSRAASTGPLKADYPPGSRGVKSNVDVEFEAFSKRLTKQDYSFGSRLPKKNDLAPTSTDAIPMSPLDVKRTTDYLFTKMSSDLTAEGGFSFGARAKVFRNNLLQALVLLTTLGFLSVPFPLN